MNYAPVWNRILCGFLSLGTTRCFSILNWRRLGYHCSYFGTVVIQSERRESFLGHFASSRLEFVEEADEKADEASQDTLVRWERMYEEGEASKQATTLTKTSSDSSERMIDSFRIIQQAQPTEVSVVTFDLDNTLWKTSETISTANDALAEQLQRDSVVVSRRIEDVMGDLFQANRQKYCPQCQDEFVEQSCKAPVLLTQLRIDAIRHMLETENDYSPELADAYSKTAFDAWAQARHDAILDNLAPQVIETLATIRNGMRRDDGSSVLIGAITDGNSDPFRVEALRTYFDFCINAESVGVAKPNKQVYLEAMRTIVSNEKFAQQLSDQLGDVSTTNDEFLEGITGPYWVHVGDDFLKDIVAAKNLKMRTIWAVGLIQDKLLSRATVPEQNGDNDCNTSMSMEDFMKTVSSQNVVSLGIGADDYLASSLTGDFVDAVAESFVDIGRILMDWQSLSSKQAIGVLHKPSTESQCLLVTNGSNASLDEASTVPLVAVNQESEMVPRAFRIVRDDCSMDIPAPLRERALRTMKEVMSIAQLDKSSGVFSFSTEDAAALQAKTKRVLVQIGGTDLEFSKELFSAMSVEDVLSLTEENPVTLSFKLKDANTCGGDPIDLF